ncbi:sensor histidine kinase [Motiliproteus sp.]|uniref:sensor histidine kinase n=1 Tax=Motiliproteus sp. TaxID=1898955 RepID=UPI003BAA1313
MTASDSAVSPRAVRNYSLPIVLGALLFGVLLGNSLLSWTEDELFSELDRIGGERLDLYASTIAASQSRFDYLPVIIAGDAQVRQLLQTGDSGSQEVVNRKLEKWQQESGAAYLYLMNLQGQAVAASNWQSPTSFVGNNYSFRPYFQDAIAGKAGRFFAVGVTTGLPGFFLARPVRFGDQILGVAVVKVDMAQLETDWSAGGENVWVSDADGVIFLASNPDWKYRSVSPLAPAIHQRLRDERKYHGKQIEPLALQSQQQSPQGNQVIRLLDDAGGAALEPGPKPYLLHQRQLESLNWTLYYLSDLSLLTEHKQQAVLMASLISALLAVVGLFVSSRWRHQQLLEQRVASRTAALNQSNAQLKREIQERLNAEEELRQTHEGLIQAEKLAALGQLSAGLVHEISQPISAIRTFLASTRLLVERDQTQAALENIRDIDGLIGRVTGIVSHLKTFASKSRGTTSPVELGQLVDNALMILRPQLAKQQVELDWQRPAEPLHVQADEIKLEQILVNLIRNGLDAIQACPQRDGWLQIRLQQEDGGERSRILISDNGCGIDPDDLPKVFDPFFTTKEPGEGLGLGLSVSYGIAREFGGDLHAEPRPEGGTRFTLSLSQRGASEPSGGAAADADSNTAGSP